MEKVKMTVGEVRAYITESLTSTIPFNSKDFWGFFRDQNGDIFIISSNFTSIIHGVEIVDFPVDACWYDIFNDRFESYYPYTEKLGLFRHFVDEYPAAIKVDFFHSNIISKLTSLTEKEMSKSRVVIAQRNFLQGEVPIVFDRVVDDNPAAVIGGKIVKPCIDSNIKKIILGTPYIANNIRMIDDGFEVNVVCEGGVWRFGINTVKGYYDPSDFEDSNDILDKAEKKTIQWTNSVTILKDNPASSFHFDANVLFCVLKISAIAAHFGTEEPLVTEFYSSAMKEETSMILLPDGKTKEVQVNEIWRSVIRTKPVNGVYTETFIGQLRQDMGYQVR